MLPFDLTTKCIIKNNGLHSRNGCCSWNIDRSLTSCRDLEAAECISKGKSDVAASGRRLNLSDSLQAPALGKSHPGVSLYHSVCAAKRFAFMSSLYSCVGPLTPSFSKLPGHLTCHVTECLSYRDTMSTALLNMPSTSPFLWYYLMFQRLPFKLAISQRASRGQLSHPSPGCQDKQWLRVESPWDEAIDLDESHARPDNRYQDQT